MRDLGTVLTVWAHPDDETYLVGGLSAALTDAGQRVACVTATRGEAGGTAAGLAEIRTAELEAALELLGVEEHHWLDYRDGSCAAVDPDQAAARIRAVSRWVDRALEDRALRLLHAVAREHPVDPGLDEDFGVFELGRPRVCADAEIDVLLPLDEALLDRKVAALLAQESQTAGLVSAVGLPRFRAWVATEAFAVPEPG